MAGITRATMNSMRGTTMVAPLTRYIRHVPSLYQARWSSDMTPILSKKAMEREYYLVSFRQV